MDESDSDSEKESSELRYRNGGRNENTQIMLQDKLIYSTPSIIQTVLDSDFWIWINERSG